MKTLIAVLGQQIRVDIRWGTGIPLVLCNGIGASLEVLDPFVAQLDPATTVVRFDVPGSGASPDSPFPYRFPYLAAVLGTLLKKVGIIDRRAGLSQVDVLGLSWGGGLAQQFAFQNPRRCRRLILVSTGTGSLMIPGKPSVLAKMLTARRFLDHRYAATIAPEIYGGTARSDPTDDQARLRPPADGRLARRVYAPAAGRCRVDQRFHAAARPAAHPDRRG